MIIKSTNSNIEIKKAKPFQQRNETYKHENIKLQEKLKIKKIIKINTIKESALHIVRLNKKGGLT